MDEVCGVYRVTDDGSIHNLIDKRSVQRNNVDKRGDLCYTGRILIMLRKVINREARH